MAIKLTRKQYIAQIDKLTEDIGTEINLDPAEYQKKIARLLYAMPVEEIGFPETVFLLCKGVRDEIEGTKGN